MVEETSLLVEMRLDLVLQLSHLWETLEKLEYVHFCGAKLGRV